MGLGNLTPQAERASTAIFDSWNAMICTAAEQHGFACADIYHAFNGPEGSKASGDLLAGDYIHPSDKGNALIAETLTAQGFAPLA
ncbi:MAG TPA: SGNH/GDSL hydrolase family protein [Dermatophilaceae bacterium]|nr:SGNH/GDSL hydrolase family protein [Dermatophilaceae bacterium]